MATIKSYTDLEQSRKLAEILPLESSDMLYSIVDNEAFICLEHHNEYKQIPCWSLASLLGIVSEDVSLNSFKDGNWNAMVQQNGRLIYSNAGNPIDACYELILKLNKLNLL